MLIYLARLNVLSVLRAHLPHTYADSGVLIKQRLLNQRSASLHEEFNFPVATDDLSSLQSGYTYTRA